MRRLATMLCLIGLTGLLTSGSAGAAEHGSHGSYEKKAEASSENFEKKIESLKEEAKGLTGEARAEAEAKIERAQEKWDAACRARDRMKPGDPKSGMMMKEKSGMMMEEESGMMHQASGMAGKSWEKMKSMTQSGYAAAAEAYNEAAVYLGLKASQTDPEGKAELEKRIENYLASLKNRLQSAQEAAEELPEDSRAEAEKLVGSVQEKWDRAEKELARMRKAGAEAGQDAWSGLKDEMSTALDELNRTYRSAADYLWGESS